MFQGAAIQPEQDLDWHLYKVNFHKSSQIDQGCTWLWFSSLPTVGLWQVFGKKSYCFTRADLDLTRQIGSWLKYGVFSKFFSSLCWSSFANRKGYKLIRTFREIWPLGSIMTNNFKIGRLGLLVSALHQTFWALSLWYFQIKCSGYYNSNWAWKFLRSII